MTMYKRIASGVAGTVVGLFLISATVLAQQAPSHGKDMHHAHPSTRDPISRNPAPTLAGQDAFGAIQEIVRILEADPTTDWNKVDLERLRQHLIDMNEVTLRAGVRAEPVSGGLQMDITGTGRTEQAIRAMVGPHTHELNQMKEWSARAEAVPGGLRLTVLAKEPADTKTIARIRGLGFIGLLVQGAHHQRHHLAMARGEAIASHGH